MKSLTASQKETKTLIGLPVLFALAIFVSAVQLYAAGTKVTNYYDDRKGAMALNYDTELYLAGMIHSGSGYTPATAASRAQNTLDGWPNIITDCETYGIPVSFNICGFEAVFGNTGRGEVNDIDIFQPWHSDPHWSTNTWYSDMPLYSHKLHDGGRPQRIHPKLRSGLWRAAYRANNELRRSL